MRGQWNAKIEHSFVSMNQQSGYSLSLSLTHTQQREMT
uniref:Uncharacterized protein n=1 Tax=Anguilla anguilla TaxID=7936 RepID=A0A0E9PVP2_ANGAN